MKNIATVLATATTLSYICGYLALRARAHAFGTDPAFTLLDEAYVFAGFRFLFVSLMILLIISPVVFAFRTGLLWLYQRVPDSLSEFSQWSVLVVLAVLTLVLTTKILSAHSILLNDNLHPKTLMEEAIMGSLWSVILLALFMALTALSVFWLKTRLETDSGTFVWVLTVVVSIQIFLLPIAHGALYADRKVRVYNDIPKKIAAVKPPLGVVDRTSEHVTLLGLDTSNKRFLTTIKLDDLNGLAVSRIVSIGDFVTQLTLAEQSQEGRDSEMSNHNSPGENKKDKPGNNFIVSLLKKLQLTLESIGSLGESGVDHGQIWSVSVAETGAKENAVRLSQSDRLAWPVSGPDQTVYALDNGKLVQLAPDGSIAQSIGSQQWDKLLGVSEQGDVLGLVYENEEIKPVVQHKDGSFESVQQYDKESLLILTQESRAYTGTKHLFVDRSTRGGRGYDVFYQVGSKVHNLSDCADDRCGQPSLSASFDRVLFVKKLR